MTMKVVVTSEPDRDDLFAEIHENDQPWAEMAFDAADKRFILTIYPRSDTQPHVFDLRETEAAISDARDALIRRGYSPT